MSHLPADIAPYIPDDPRDQTWDIVVVGTGAGGGSAGLNLARLGRSVLFLDRASASPSCQTPFTSPWTTYPGFVDLRGQLTNDQTGSEQTTHSVIIGSDIGGSTASFSMVMDRFRPIDFKPGLLSGVPASASLPTEWPIQYEELEPYYQQAESLFRVRGTDDALYPTRAPLMEPAAPSATEAELLEVLVQSGLHPYRIHYAREHVPGCDGCVSKLCVRNCRNDSARMCVLPALRHHGAYILPDCDVVELKTKGRAVSQAICLWKNQRVAIRARIFVLALNALLTPLLLLRSANASFPDGLGNQSGLVGRNLMLHVSDILAVSFKKLEGQLNGRLSHGLSMNDFYLKDGVKLGNIHAHSFDFSEALKEFQYPNDREGLAWFFSILEDFPYSANRVVPSSSSGDGVKWEYVYPDELRARNGILIDALTASLQAVAEVRVCGKPGRLNAAHMCGTCRFGNDKRLSVLDCNNRIHELDNAYVLDASFFPSSGGINPSLTIAANSLRVSELIANA